MSGQYRTKFPPDVVVVPIVRGGRFSAWLGEHIVLIAFALVAATAVLPLTMALKSCLSQREKERQDQTQLRDNCREACGKFGVATCEESYVVCDLTKIVK